MKNALPDIVQEWLDEQEEKGKKTSITQLAQMANLNPSTLSRMLKGDPRRIDLDTVEALRQVIGFDKNDVIIEIAE